MQSILKPEYCMPVMINNTVPTSVTKSRAERLDTLSYRTVRVALLKLVGGGVGDFNYPISVRWLLGLVFFSHTYKSPKGTRGFQEKVNRYNESCNSFPQISKSSIFVRTTYPHQSIVTVYQGHGWLRL